MDRDDLKLMSMKQAIDSLERALAQPVDEFVRDAVIQRFKYTFELAWKMIKRHLESAGIVETSPLSRKELFREAARAGLIDDPEPWFRYGAARNQTSHIYNLQTANEVYKVASEFLPDVKTLLVQLEQKHD